MPATWKCPHCGTEFVLGPEILTLREARRQGAVVVAFVSSTTRPCPSCGHEIDSEALASGRYDVDRTAALELTPPPSTAACAFCGTPTSDPASAATVWARRRGSEEASKPAVKVPRCARCRGVHVRGSVVAMVFGAMGFLAVAGFIAHRYTTTGKNFNDEPFSLGSAIASSCFMGGIAALLACGVGLVVARMIRPTGVKPESAKCDHPFARDLEGRGLEVDRNA